MTQTRSCRPLTGPAATESFHPSKEREPGFHMYMPLRDLEHAAAGLCPSLATVSVLMAYAHRTDVDGVTRASVREIARGLDRSPGTVHGHVQRLVELGFLEQLGDCREGNRHRPWRVAGMDRRNKLAGGAGENHHRGGTSARGGSARKAMDVTSGARGGSARTLLSGELLIETTRASTQQEPYPASDWGRATPAGIRASREALRERRAREGAPADLEAPEGARDAPTVPDAGFEAQKATEDSAEGAV
jgi:hypothetical protein